MCSFKSAHGLIASPRSGIAIQIKLPLTRFHFLTMGLLLPYYDTAQGSHQEPGRCQHPVLLFSRHVILTLADLISVGPGLVWRGPGQPQQLRLHLVT